MQPEQIIQTVERFAGEPLLAWERGYLDFHAARYQATLAALGPGEGKRLLDVGSFPGHLLAAAREMGWRTQALTGRDENNESLKIILNRFARNQVEYRLADVEHDTWPFEPESFDFVMGTEIIEHLHYNPFHLLAQAFRVLKPGGVVMITTPNLARWENGWLLLAGKSINPSLEGAFYESFSSILSHRHVREYTAGELAHLLAGQDKQSYRFEKAAVEFSACFDQQGFTWKGAPAWLAKKFFPRFRSMLIAKAARPQNLRLLEPREISPAQGLHPVEEHQADTDGTARILTTPFRWTQGETILGLPASQAPIQVFTLLAANLAPMSLAPRLVRVWAGDSYLGRVSLPSGRKYTPMRLALPAGLSVDGRFPVRLQCETWRPSDHPTPHDWEFSQSDPRDLGIILAWDGVLREDLADPAELARVFEREAARQPLASGEEPAWTTLTNLYPTGAARRASLDMGPDDWRQLGPGWHHRETWDQGPVRWSSGEAEAYLAAPAGSRRVIVSLYSGEYGLGEFVNGTLKLETAEDGLAYQPLLELPFQIPAATWEELSLNLPQSLDSLAILRVTLLVQPARTPAQLLAGNGDTRELGVAVKRIKVE